MTKLVSKNCVDFVKKFEGFYPKPYLDMVGVKTLGYGMTGEEIKGLTSVTEVQASNMLEDLLNNKYALPIKNSLEARRFKLKQNEFDALVSMAYNIGINGLLGSTLYKNVTSGIKDKATITSNFQAWSMAGGNKVAGLYRRRTEEAAMFFTDCNELKKNEYCLKWQAFYNNITQSKKQLIQDGLCGNTTLESLDFLLGYVKQGKKYKYCLAFQEFYNKATGTRAPILEDGYYGPSTQKSYETLIKLIKGEY